jgi:hypothetical protein
MKFETKARRHESVFAGREDETPLIEGTVMTTRQFFELLWDHGDVSSQNGFCTYCHADDDLVRAIGGNRLTTSGKAMRWAPGCDE